MNTDKNKNKWIKITELEIGVNIKKSKEVGERQEKKKTIIVGERVVREIEEEEWKYTQNSWFEWVRGQEKEALRKFTMYQIKSS